MRELVSSRTALRRNRHGENVGAETGRETESDRRDGVIVRAARACARARAACPPVREPRAEGPSTKAAVKTTIAVRRNHIGSDLKVGSRRKVCALPSVITSFE